MRKSIVKGKQFLGRGVLYRIVFNFTQ